MSSPIQNFIPCANHPSKLAKKYCANDKCKSFICNGCALSFHADHISEVQNLNTLYVSNTNLLNKLLSVSEKNKNYSKDLSFKCMNFVFHQAKHYCKQCNGFICQKCMANHEQGHTFVSLDDYMNNFKDLIQFFISIINFDSNSGINQNFEILPKKYEKLIEKFDKILENFSDYKFKISQIIKKRNTFLLNYIQKIHKFYIQKQNLIAKNKDLFKKLVKLIDDIKFEKDEKKVFKYYIDFQVIVENMFINDAEKDVIHNLYNQLNTIKDKINTLNESLLSIIEKEMTPLLGDNSQIFENINKILDEHDSSFKTDICKVLEIDEAKYDELYSDDILNKESKKYDIYEGSRKDLVPLSQEKPKEIVESVQDEQIKEQKEQIQEQVKPEVEIKEVIKEVEKVIIKEIEKIVPINKNKFTDVDTICVNNVCDLEMKGIEKEPQVKEVVKEIIKEVYIKEEPKKDDEHQETKITKIVVPLAFEFVGSLSYSGIEKKKIENISHTADNFNIIGIQKENVIQPVVDQPKEEKKIIPNEPENKEQFSIIHEKVVIPHEKENSLNFTIEKSYETAKSKPNEQLPSQNNISPQIEPPVKEPQNQEVIPQQTGEGAPQTEEQNEEQEEQNQEEEEEEQNENQEEEENNDEEQPQEENTITASAQEPNDSDIKGIQPTVVNMINNLMASNPPIEEKKKILSSVSWNERNFLEIIALGQNCKTSFVFNPYLLLIEEIEFDFPFKLPAFHSFINIHPYLYLSGGKNNESSSGNELDTFYRLRRSEEKSFTIKNLPSMTEARFSHTMVYIQKLNSICVISGSRLKSCEMFDLDSQTWSSLPLLIISREKASAVVVNDEYLYVFFGFDRTKSKFVTTIERLSLETLSQWESISIPGNQNILKKQGMSCLISPDGKLLLVGGINSLRNESKDILEFDPNTKKAGIFSSLPAPCSFTHVGFTQLTDGYWYNITENFDVVRYDAQSQQFSFVK